MITPRGAQPARRARVTQVRLLLPILLAVLPASVGAPGRLQAKRRPVGMAARIVLGSADGEERELDVPDLAFVFYARTYFHRRAPRSENASGRRVDIEDRRKECLCLRFDDWSKIKLGDLRQIEISYPDAGGEARVRLTDTDGGMREVAAGSLAGASTSMPPRFAATVDGALREFPLILGANASEPSPDERLLRVLLALPRPRARPRR